MWPDDHSHSSAMECHKSMCIEKTIKDKAKRSSAIVEHPLLSSYSKSKLSDRRR